MKIYLLTHERELNKASNTGRLVKKCLKEQAEVIIWKRKEPDETLLELICSGELAMLFPEQKQDQPASTEPVSIENFERFIILDSTWQEARKMYNRSFYLQQIKKINLNTKQTSVYCKRRNQIEGGLSTAECVIELLKQKKNKSLAKSLQTEFDLFNK